MTPNNTPIESWTVAISADTAGFEEQMKAVTLSGKQFSSALSTAFDGLALKGKSLSDVFGGVALSLSKMALQSAFKPLEQGLGSMLSGLFSGNGFGGALQGSLGGGGGMTTPFASGGVIQSPIAFPLGVGHTGIAGERGAEAIMPLARGPDGRLGVASSGGGSAVNVTFNVQATDAESFTRSQTQIAALLSRTVSMGQRNL
jgi:phage-related minor tail protein